MTGKWAGRRFFVLLVLLLLAGLSVGRSEQAIAAESQTQANAELVRRAFADVLNGDSPGAMAEMFSAGFRHFDGGTPAVVLSVNGFGLRQSLYRQAMPDLHYQIEELAAFDNRVVTRWRAGGTHTGQYQLYPPSGLALQWTGITIWQVDDERITVAWSQQDDLGLARQLGVINGRAQDWGPMYYR